MDNKEKGLRGKEKETKGKKGKKGKKRMGVIDRMRISDFLEE